MARRCWGSPRAVEEKIWEVERYCRSWMREEATAAGERRSRRRAWAERSNAEAGGRGGDAAEEASPGRVMVAVLTRGVVERVPKPVRAPVLLKGAVPVTVPPARMRVPALVAVAAL